MKNIPFTKMVASGNDFVVIDNRKNLVKNRRAFTQKVCAWHTGIGADGVLFFEKSTKAAFKMRIVNSDGSEAEACGNGFRCIARYAKEKLGYPAEFEFESLAGKIKTAVMKRSVRVGLVRPSGLRLQSELVAEGHRLHYSFVNTGVPHAVILVEGLEKMDVPYLGRLIRTHKDFQPKGTNVNFIEIKDAKNIQVRTYERGVENETLACGTGSTASAIISALLGYTQPPVHVKTKSGEILTVSFTREGNQLMDVTLEGEASIVFEGMLSGF